MERDKTHYEQIERWAKYVKENPDNWKFEFKPFIDSQILIARRFYKKLSETPEGKVKLIRLRKLNS
mgnify:CR=1 FL=1